MLRYLVLPAIALVAIGCSQKGGSPTRKSEYAPASACQGCHPRVAKTYHSVAMARSLYQPSEANIIEDYSGRNQFFHAPSNRYYRMFRRDGKFFQRRYQLGAQGSEENAFEQEVTYIIASGEHARSYLPLSSTVAPTHLPVTWHSQQQRWRISPR